MRLFHQLAQEDQHNAIHYCMHLVVEDMLEDGVQLEPFSEEDKRAKGILEKVITEAQELPKEEQRTIKVNGQDFSIVTIGNKWTAKQIEEYKTSSQPYYVLQTTEGKDIPVGSADYQNHGSPEVFKKWLEKGLDAYKK